MKEPWDSKNDPHTPKIGITRLDDLKSRLVSTVVVTLLAKVHQKLTGLQSSTLVVLLKEKIYRVKEHWPFLTA